jgi:aldehyde dehydrogenase (NAD+)
MTNIAEILKNLGITTPANGDLSVYTPIDGTEIAKLKMHTPEQVNEIANQSYDSFLKWRSIPAPKRGELIRLFADILREYKQDLGRLVTIENGKILEEGYGEVQEMIDICDFAVGLSRQLYGLTIASERPGHHMRETWHPLGPVGIISAFNFPVAVWAWNFTLAIVCGDSVVWKPSEKTPLTALACQQLFNKAIEKFKGDVSPHLLQVIIGNRFVGEVMVEHNKMALISATGSCTMGRDVYPRVAKRLGKCLLELGGNNAMILAPSADIELALHAIIFSAVGTTGQRCTTLRRVIVHESIKNDVIGRLKKIYMSLPIGNPCEKENLVGPLIDKHAYEQMQTMIAKLRDRGVNIFGGKRILEDKYPDAWYVTPAIAELNTQIDLVKTETFAPLLYVIPYINFDDAIAMHNDVPQGLSSCIFTNDVREAEKFMSCQGSDCGIANVNIGPSGAEIGGAFGGEKDTGGGRESGSDAWRTYMRRQTNTVNYSKDLPLAQGIKFDTNFQK